MRVVFGALSLLVVLAIVGFTASRQLRATGLAAAAPAASVPGKPGQVSQKVADQVTRAIEQGAAAARDEADK